jgi:hypothetical protein
MKERFNVLIFILFFYSAAVQSQSVLINEFLSSNSSTNSDPDFGLHSDWIELYNDVDSAVDLSNWFITDDLNDSTKWQIPEGVVIEAGEFLVIWADENDTSLIHLHTSFRLSKSGEAIGLFDSDTILIDSIVYQEQFVDISFGRHPDGSTTWNFFDTPTLGMSNDVNPYLKVTKPEFSLPAGFYTVNQVLEISHEDPVAIIRYTINGDEPTESSPIYTTSIPIQSRIGEANVFSMIRTTLDPHLWLPDWQPPEGEVFKANVIRAKAFRNGYNPSEIVTSTYFVDADINQRYATLPVISLTSDYKHLFDDNTGIYVPGINHKPFNSGSGNYFEDWEKPAHIEYFEPGGAVGFAQNIGIRIQGGTSPASPQKGLHVIARSEYGKNRINYPIFQKDLSKANKLTEYKRFIIRAWGSLITGTLFNDAYGHRLMAKSDLDIQAYQPAIVFINGEYWGIHELREANKNSWYFQYHYDINRDEPGYDVLIHTKRNGSSYPQVDEGDNNHWNEMMNYINTHNMNLPNNYDHLKTLIDIDNFIAYMGHCIYVGKWDWPNNNDASWRPRTVDGKWKWIQYDMETSFGVATGLGPMYSMLGPQLNMLKATIVGIDIPGFERYGPHPIMKRIYNNEEFKETFIDWFDYHMDHEFHPDSMNLVLDSMVAGISPYMEEYKHRWPFIGSINGQWGDALEIVRDFNERRPEYMRNHLLEYELGQLTPVEDRLARDGYQLLTNVLDPASRETLIVYQIPEAVDIVVEVYNMQGQKLTSFNRRHTSGGKYSINLNDGSFSNGLYIVALKVHDFCEVEKMVLLK